MLQFIMWMVKKFELKKFELKKNFELKKFEKKNFFGPNIRQAKSGVF